MIQPKLMKNLTLPGLPMRRSTSFATYERAGSRPRLPVDQYQVEGTATRSIRAGDVGRTARPRRRTAEPHLVTRRQTHRLPHRCPTDRPALSQKETVCLPGGSTCSSNTRLRTRHRWAGPDHHRGRSLHSAPSRRGHEQSTRLRRLAPTGRVPARHRWQAFQPERATIAVLTLPTGPFENVAGPRNGVQVEQPDWQPVLGCRPHRSPPAPNPGPGVGVQSDPVQPDTRSTEPDLPDLKGPR